MVTAARATYRNRAGDASALPYPLFTHCAHYCLFQYAGPAGVLQCVRDRSPQGRDAPPNRKARLGREAMRYLYPEPRKAWRKGPGARKRATPIASLQIATDILRRFFVTDDLKRVCWQHAGLDRFDLLRWRIEPFFARGLVR